MKAPPPEKTKEERRWFRAVLAVCALAAAYVAYLFLVEGVVIR